MACNNGRTVSLRSGSFARGPAMSHAKRLMGDAKLARSLGRRSCINVAKVDLPARIFPVMPKIIQVPPRLFGILVRS